MTTRTLALFATCCLLGCTAQVGVHQSVDLPSDAAATCERQCEHVGLDFDGLAIVSNNVACLCSRPGAPSALTATQRAAASSTLASEDDDEPSLP